LNYDTSTNSCKNTLTILSLHKYKNHYHSDSGYRFNINAISLPTNLQPTQNFYAVNSKLENCR